MLTQTYSIVLTAILGYIVWLLKQQARKHEQDALERDKRIKEEREIRAANNRGTMLLLRVHLIEYHDKYTRKGSIPSYAYQNFNDMYSAYHALGGNGMVTKMKQEVDSLRIVKKGNEEDV